MNGPCGGATPRGRRGPLHPAAASGCTGQGRKPLPTPVDAPMTTTPAYAALLAVLFVALSVRTVRLRRRLGIAIGDAGQPRLLRAMRVHANFAEYVPFALLLVAFVELQAAPSWLVHALGATLLGGRLLHAFGVSREPERFGYRVAGMALTFSVMLTAAALLSWNAVRAAAAG